MSRKSYKNYRQDQIKRLQLRWGCLRLNSEYRRIFDKVRRQEDLTPGEIKICTEKWHMPINPCAYKPPAFIVLPDYALRSFKSAYQKWLKDRKLDNLRRFMKESTPKDQLANAIGCFKNKTADWDDLYQKNAVKSFGVLSAGSKRSEIEVTYPKDFEDKRSIQSGMSNCFVFSKETKGWARVCPPRERIRVEFDPGSKKEEVDKKVEALFKQIRKLRYDHSVRKELPKLHTFNEALKIYEMHIYLKKSLTEIAKTKKPYSAHAGGSQGAYNLVKKRFKIARHYVEGGFSEI